MPHAGSVISRIGAAAPSGAWVLLLLPLLWLPGQSHAGAARGWFVAGVLPLVVARRLSRGHPASGAWLLPWAALAVLALAAAPWLRDPGGGPATFLVQTGWLAALALGLSEAADDEAPVAGFAAVAGVAAALPGLWVRGGAFGNADLLAGFLVGTVLWSARLLRAPGRGVRVGAGVCLALQGAALLRCESLGAWLALGAGAWAAWSVAGPGPRTMRVAAPAVVLAACLTVPAVREHLRGRAWLASVSVEAAAASPTLGAGPGQFRAAFLEAQSRRPPDARWTNAAHAHAEPLHAWVEQGLPGVALLLLPVVAALLRPRPGPAWPTVAAYSILGLVSLPLHEPATAWLAAYSVGRCLAAGRARAAPASGVTRGASDAHHSGAAQGAPRLLGLGFAALALPLATVDLLGDRLLVRGAREGRPELLAAAAGLSLRPGRALRHRADALRPQDPDGALDAARDAAAREPSPVSLALVGRCAEAAGRLPEAIGAYEAALRLNPRLFAAHYNLALLHDWRGDRFAARAHAARARALRPGDARLKRLPR